MPLPLIPIIAGLAAFVTGGYGVKKAIDAKKNFDIANDIGRDAEDQHKTAVELLDSEKSATNQVLEELGRLKVKIFSHQIKYLVDVISRIKSASSKIQDFEQQIDELDLPQMNAMVISSLEIEKGLLSGAVTGTFAGLGAYGSVGALASASTGTAIASLSGVAAKNATLAWLGGGALKAGGLGMAGGGYVLGGIVAGPAIAITGLVIASKSEKALTEAIAYKGDIDKAIAEIDGMKVVLKGLQANAQEVQLVLGELVKKFEDIKVPDDADKEKFNRMLSVGKALKQVLDTPIMKEDGTAVENIQSKIAATTSGIIEYRA